MDADRRWGLPLTPSAHRLPRVRAGKYSSSNLPSGPRGQIYAPILEQMDPLLAYMKQLGETHGGKTHTQVALNYLVSQGDVMPIPGAKTAAQAEEFAGALVRRLLEPLSPYKLARRREERRRATGKVEPCVPCAARRMECGSPIAAPDQLSPLQTGSSLRTYRSSARPRNARDCR